MYCPQCGLQQPRDHRFCLACGSRLPPRVLARRGPKVSRWFWAVPVAPQDDPNTALRISRYLQEYEIESAEGSVRIPSHHVRISIWVRDQAVAALSLPDGEARALADFLTATVIDGEDADQLTEGSPA
jgi:hypothetical protein